MLDEDLLNTTKIYVSLIMLLLLPYMIEADEKAFEITHPKRTRESNNIIRKISVIYQRACMNEDGL